MAFASPTLTDTPSWTRLDDPAGPYTVTGWSVQRGRSYELDRTGPGTATVTFVDTAGNFDPTNPSGPFYGNLNPMKQAAIGLQNPVTSAWSTVFHGFVSDWTYDMYPTEDYATVTLQLVDAFDLLASAEMTPSQFGDPAPTESLGDVYYGEAGQVAYRINQVLDEAGWPVGMREIFSGNITLRYAVYPVRAQALTVIQDAADADFPGVANVFVRKDGAIVFHGRYARFRPATVEYDIDTWKCGDVAAVTADSTYATIFGLEYSRGKAALINSALALPQGALDSDIAGNLRQNTTSIGTYGTRSVSFENLLTLTSHEDGSTALEETAKFGGYYRDNYAAPRTRVNRVTFRSLPAAHPNAARVWALMCGVDISDMLRLKTTHGGGGGFDNEELFVEGVQIEARPGGGKTDVTMSLDVTPRSYYSTEPVG